MSLSDLDAYVHDNSPAWYSFIIHRFCSLRQFLSLYSFHFRIVQVGRIEVVSLVKDKKGSLFMTEDEMQNVFALGWFHG